MTTYNLDTSVGKVRLTLGDTNTDAACFTDAELQAFLDRYEGLATARREDWAAAEAVESLLLNDGRLVGVSSILGVDLDSVGWRAAARDRIGYLRSRHALGPS